MNPKLFNSIYIRIFTIILVGIIPILGLHFYLDISWQQQSHALRQLHATETGISISKECNQALRPIWDFLGLARKLILGGEPKQNLSPVFTRLLGHSTKFIALMLVDNQGNLIHGSSRAQQTVSFLTPSFLQKALNSRDGVASTLTNVRGTNILLFAIPVQRQTVAVLAVDARWFSQLVAGFKIPGGSELTLTDRYGSVLSSTNPSLVIAHPYPASDILGQILIHPEYIAIHQSKDGTQQLRHIISVPGSGHGIKLCITHPMQKLYGPVDQVFLKRLMLVLLGALSALAIALYLAWRWLARPVTEIAEWAPKAGLVPRQEKWYGEFGHIAVAIQQLTQSLRERQQYAAQSSERFERIINMLGGAVLVVDAKSHNITFCNQVAQKLLRNDLLLNTPLSQIVIHEQQPSLEKTLVEFIAGIQQLQKVDKQFFIELPNRQRIALQPILSKVVFESGMFIIVLLQEITRPSRLNPETLPQPKNTPVVNELEQLTYMASHDLQEPLRMVIMYLELLQNRYRQKLDKDAQEFIGFAVDGAQRMQQMIRGLLNYAQAGALPTSATRLNMNNLVARVLKDLHIMVQEAAAKIQCDPLPEIEGHEVETTQIFTNLLSNALKFRKHNEPLHITISAEDLAEGVVFKIQDNGIGFDNKFTERVFGLFQRLHQHDPNYQGTGIGLATIRKLVESRGGRVWAESQPGQGATFYVMLPKPSQQRQQERV